MGKEEFLHYNREGTFVNAGGRNRSPAEGFHREGLVFGSGVFAARS
jgi:hypothetical protein